MAGGGGTGYRARIHTNSDTYGRRSLTYQNQSNKDDFKTIVPTNQVTSPRRSVGSTQHKKQNSLVNFLQMQMNNNNNMGGSSQELQIGMGYNNNNNNNILPQRRTSRMFSVNSSVGDMDEEIYVFENNINHSHSYFIGGNGNGNCKYNMALLQQNNMQLPPQTLTQTTNMNQLMFGGININGSFIVNHGLRNLEMLRLFVNAKVMLFFVFVCRCVCVCKARLCMCFVRCVILLVFIFVLFCF